MRAGTYWRIRSVGLWLSRLLAEDPAQHETDVGRAFAEPAHEVREPLGSEGHVDAERVAFGGKRRVQVAPDPVEHLELERRPRDLPLLGERFRRGDHRGVVRGDGRI